MASAVRIIVTDRSVWTLDYGRMSFRRDPRVQGNDHPIVSYTGEWRDFESLVESTAFGHPGRIRFTVYGEDVDGAGSGWITSTYKPGEQGVTPVA